MSSTPQATPAARRDLAQIVAIVRSFARAHIALRGARRGARIRCYGRLLVPEPEGVEVGPKAVFLRGPIPTELRCDAGAQLFIGSGTVLSHGVSIVASRRVHIGARCMIASAVHVRDDDGRRTAPVTIGDDVWLAHGAVVEPGSTIGDGSVVATLAVVSGAVPPRSLVAGNPARCLPLQAVPAGAVEAIAPHRPTRPSSGAVRAAIIEWLDDTRLFGAASALVADDSISLVAAGLLDSLGLVQLTGMLEERFGVRIDRDSLTALDAASIAALVDLVTQTPAGRS
jgi:maltose O-acetyltransferase